MITRYESEVEDITFETLNEKLQRVASSTPGAGGGGAPGPSATPTPTAGQAPSAYEQYLAELRGLIQPKLIKGEWWAVDERGNVAGGPYASQEVAAAEIAAGRVSRLSTANGGVTTPSPTGGSSEPSGSGAVGPAGRTAAQIRGTDYLSDAERQWYLQQTGGSPTPARSAAASSGGGSSRASSGSGGSGGGGSAAAVATPPAPLRNSAEDLANRGAIKLGTTAVLDGTQYRKPPEVVQAPDGQYYVVGPGGMPIQGPFPNQAQANRANVYVESGPAVTTNKYAALGEAARQGAGRQRVSAGSGQGAAIKLDDIIGATYSRDDLPGDYLGSTNAFGSPVDILRGGVPDYGGMYEVPGGGYTGRMLGEDGREVAIGMSAPSQTGNTGVGSHAWTTFSPYLSQSQIDRIDPNKYAELALKLGSLRDQGLIQQADTMTPNNRGGRSSDSAGQAANWAALGMDPWELDMLPEPYADGGSFMVREPSVIRGLQSGRNYGVMGASPERVTITPTGTQGQQQQANKYEQLIANRLGPVGSTRASPVTDTSLAQAQRQLEINNPRVQYQTPPNPYASQGWQIVDGLLQRGDGSFAGTPIWNDDGTFRQWAIRRPRWHHRDVMRQMAAIRAMYGDEEEEPGDEYWPDIQPAPTSPTPNIYARGGEMIFRPEMPASSRPAYLRALSAGIRRTMKLDTPAVAV